MMSKTEDAWAAGLFEGEGSVGLNQGRYLYIQMATTDKDVLQRFAAWGSLTVTGPYKYTNNRKPYWRVAVQGKLAYNAMERMLPYLGERRTTRYNEIRERSSTSSFYRIKSD